MTEILNRLSSPISGSFVIAFLLHNWELSFKVFSSAIPLDKCIEFVRSDASWIHFFLVPACYTLLYLVTMPLFLIGLNYIKDWIARIDKKREVKHKSEIYNLESLHNVMTKDNFFAMANLVVSYKKSEVDVRKIIHEYRLDNKQSGCIVLLDEIDKDIDRAFTLPNNECAYLEKLLGLYTNDYFTKNGSNYEYILGKLSEIVR